MYDKLVVPLDGSDAAARALKPAAVLAARYDATVKITAVVSPAFVPSMTKNAQIQAAEAGIDEPNINLVVSTRPPAVQLLNALDAEPTTLLCMATTGRSHLGQVIGSVAEAIIRARTGPFVLVGPKAATPDYNLDGPLLVATDGSAAATEIIPLAAAWSTAYDMAPHVVTVSTPDFAYESARAANAEAAGSLRDLLADGPHPHTPTSSVIEATSPAEAIAGEASRIGASLVAITTHGRTGLARVLLGSVAMDIVHRSPCPILIHRPLRLRT